MKPTENRKSNKPIMEKRRRARINQCLNELKSLILEALRKDPARHSKLEKADILEMTVKYLQNLQRQQMALKLASDPHVMSKYRAGFGECVAEVSRYLSTFDNIDTAVRERLISHLSHNFKGLPIAMSTMSTLSTSPDLSRFYRNMQLIPTRLPGGEVLFLVPSTSPLVSTFSTPALPGTPTDEPLSVEIGSAGIGEEKSSPTCGVVQDLSTKLSVSSSGSESPGSGDIGEDDDDDDDGDDDGVGAGSEPWRPW